MSGWCITSDVVWFFVFHWLIALIYKPLKWRIFRWKSTFLADWLDSKYFLKRLILYSLNSSTLSIGENTRVWYKNTTQDPDVKHIWIFFHVPLRHRHELKSRTTETMVVNITHITNIPTYIHRLLCMFCSWDFKYSIASISVKYSISSDARGLYHDLERLMTICVNVFEISAFIHSFKR